MSRVGNSLLRDARSAITADMEKMFGRIASDDAFVAWLLPKSGSIPTLSSLAKLSAGRVAQRDYRDVAVLGFHIDSGAATESERKLFHNAAHQTAGRSPDHDGNLMAFCFDATAVFGICLGVTSLGDESLTCKVSQWFDSFYETVSNLPHLPEWKRSVLCMAKEMLGTSSTVSSEHSSPDVLHALSGGKAIGAVAISECDTEAFIELVRNYGPEDETELPCLAMRLAGIDWVYRTAPTVIPRQATVEDVCSVLREFPSGFKRWCWESKPRSKKQGAASRQWHVDNEYHVQDLLYFMLRPIFPDLLDEENFPSVGHKHPRTDLYIPSLGLIIEVKFIYPKTTFAKIIEEIAADSSLYLAERSSYNRIVTFIWDDSRRTEQHARLVEGLNSIAGVVGNIVVSRPGMMGDSSAATAS